MIAFSEGWNYNSSKKYRLKIYISCMYLPEPYEYLFSSPRLIKSNNSHRENNSSLIRKEKITPYILRTTISVGVTETAGGKPKTTSQTNTCWLLCRGFWLYAVGEKWRQSLQGVVADTWFSKLMNTPALAYHISIADNVLWKKEAKIRKKKKKKEKKGKMEKLIIMAPCKHLRSVSNKWRWRFR